MLFRSHCIIVLCFIWNLDEWGKLFGSCAPTLQKFAIRILSQTAASSGCERNWSAFEQIHTKRRNRLEHQRLNDLVFVHYNYRLKERYILYSFFVLMFLWGNMSDSLIWSSGFFVIVKYK